MYTHIRHYLLIFFVAISAAVLLSWQWTLTSNAQEAINLSPDNLIKSIQQQNNSTKHEKSKIKTVKALYLTAYSAGNSKKINEIIKLIDETELNSIVIDIKDYSGNVLFSRLGDVKKLIKKLHQHKIYVIARQTVFQDPVLAKEKSEWAIKDVNGVSTSSLDGLWHDKNGLTWVDPSIKDVWSYNLAIARKAIALGFDEINFDYVRFPSDGDLSRAVFASEKLKVDVMRDFFKYLSNKLSNEPVWISIDMFGFVMEKHYGLSIGQRLEDAVDYVDFICPMMYPSHYPNGYLGFDNPAEHPTEIIENGMQKGLPYFKNNPSAGSTSSPQDGAQGKRAKVRPWIQAFDMGAVYKDGVRIREQIDAIEKYSDAGWMMWNAGNNYSAAGLKP